MRKLRPRPALLPNPLEPVKHAHESIWIKCPKCNLPLVPNHVRQRDGRQIWQHATRLDGRMCQAKRLGIPLEELTERLRRRNAHMRDMRQARVARAKQLGQEYNQLANDPKARLAFLARNAVDFLEL